jgi:hypothetical protein
LTTPRPGAVDGAVLSTGLRLALAPADAYRSLVAARSDATWRAALAGPALSLATIGVLVSIATTGRLTLELAATLAAAWSFVVVIQVAAAVALVASSPRREVSRRRAFELLFLGHAPWSLWLLGATATALALDNVRLTPLAATMFAPIAWTMVITAAFSREVVGAGRTGAVVRAIAHQAIVWGLAIQVAALAAGSWGRLIQGALRW